MSLPAPGHDSGPAARRTAVLLTGHFYEQKRRGSMHWLADELVALGWSVRFVTVGYSWLSYLLRDKRLRALGGMRPRPGYCVLRPGLATDYRITPFHPLSARSAVLDAALAPVMATFPSFWRGSLRRLAGDADLVVVESGVPVMLAPLLRQVSRAKLVYRVNDDIRLLRLPPAVVQAEARCVDAVDRISLASPVLARRFESSGKVQIDPMGLDHRQFAAVTPDPYGARWDKEVVCAGTTQFDLPTVLALTDLRPTWRFTIIGRWSDTVDRPNIVWKGETPFRDVVPYVQHADIGLAPYLEQPGVEYQTHHSNRLQQYTYLRLPVLVPSAMQHPSMPHLIAYTPGDTASMDAALHTAADHDRSAFISEVPGWSRLAEGIARVAS